MRSRLLFVVAFAVLAAVVTLLLDAATARPCPPVAVVQRGRYVEPAKRVEVVHEHAVEVVAAEFVPVAVLAVPQASVGYAPEPAPQAQAPAPAVAPPSDDVQALRKELAELRKKLESLKAGGGGGDAPAARAPSLAAKYCAGCHDAGSAKAKGDGHAFFDAAGLLTANDAQVRKMIQRVVRQQMPPQKAPQPSDEDAAALVDELTGPR